jgi:hypothetical protein
MFGMLLALLTAFGITVKQPVRIALEASETYSSPPHSGRLERKQTWDGLAEAIVYSEPIDLQFGTSFYRVNSNDSYPLPADVVGRFASGEHDMAVIVMECDLVRFHNDTGLEERVPLYQAYMHHFQLGFHAANSDGQTIIGLGSEYRNVPAPLPPLATVVLHKPTALTMPQLHVINMHDPRAAGPPSDPDPMHMCPCTPDNLRALRAGPVANITMITSAVNDPNLVEAFPYAGGMQCCLDGMRQIVTEDVCSEPDCADLPVERFYLKTTLRYMATSPFISEPTLENAIRTVQQFKSGESSLAIPAMMGCAVREQTAKGDYYIPACPVGTPPAQCVHVISYVMTLCMPNEYGGNLTNLSSFTHPQYSVPERVAVLMAYPHAHTRAPRAHHEARQPPSAQLPRGQ